MDKSNMRWYNASVYYYDEEKDHLLLDCIQPLFAVLAPIVADSFFVRHWLRGPHLRLCFLTTDRLFNEVVKPAIEEQVGSYLLEHPSQTALDEEKMRSAYQNLAKLEQEQGPILPLYPNNSIHYLPYDRRLHVLKSELLADIIEHFYAETNELTFKMLDAIRQGQSRLLLGLDLMFTTAHVTAWPITWGFISYRSHAESFISRTPNPTAMRDFFEKKYALHADKLTVHLNQLLEVLDHQQDTVPFTLEWAALIKRYWSSAVPMIEAKGLVLMPDDQSSEEDYRMRREYSLFHRRFFEMSESRERLYADPVFQAYRLALNLLYLYLNRLGVRPLERSMLGHLAANTVEAVFAISAVDLISQNAWDGA